MYGVRSGRYPFGGRSVISPLMQSDAVHVCHWITNDQFLNVVASAQITPGPSSRPSPRPATPRSRRRHARSAGRAHSARSRSPCSAVDDLISCVGTPACVRFSTGPDLRRSRDP
jgi:Chromate transporter